MAAKDTEKVNLTEAVIAAGVTYGPGEADIPASVATYLRERSPSSIAEQPAASVEGDPLASYPALAEAGYTTPAAVRAADDEALLALPGIGPAALKRLRELTKDA